MNIQPSQGNESVERISILLVCMGNICRSPTAEGVLRSIVSSEGLDEFVEIDSAGTHGYHVGEPPDQRAREAAQRRGYDLSPLRARRVSELDFMRFDRILAMDSDNLSLLQRACPPEHRHKLGLFLEYSTRFEEREVPDPYYGAGEGFERVLDLVEDASRGLVDALRRG
ncbi:MAG TPA: low molecular weight protein-tyrosine-phosphatase [Rhodocyclaceae bacterium]